jgi:hypothetical protein
MYQGGCGVPIFYTPGQSVRVGTPLGWKKAQENSTATTGKKSTGEESMPEQDHTATHRPAHEAGQGEKKREEEDTREERR